MKVTAAVKASLQRILKQQTEQELSARETELAEHISERDRLRQQLEADAAADAAEQSRHDAALAALAEFGAKYSIEERTSVRGVVDEGRRLSAEANRRPEFVRYGKGESPRERLVSGCRDLLVQNDLTCTGLELQGATIALADAEEEISRSALRAADARRDRLELLGSIQRQFGPEGARWRRVESGDDEVSVDGLQDAAGNPAVHPENVAFLNRQLAPLNRRIREYRQQSEGEGLQLLRDAVAKAEADLVAVELRAVESEV